MEIRPLTTDRVEEAAAVALEALPIPPEFDDGERLSWLTRRTAHMVRTDPDGAWMAVEGDTVTGMALAIVREGLWGLSLMAVRPANHARGTGTKLLQAALTHAGGGRGGIILSSTDPRAMRMYAQAGFDLRPCVAVAGILDRDAIPNGLRARETEDVEQAGALARPVRGAAYAPEDLALSLSRADVRLLMIPGEGLALHDAGSPVLVAARTEAGALDLLWSCFAAARPGATVHADFLMAGQDWAVQACLKARLVLSPEGPVYTRGELGPLRPFLPSGSLL